MPSCPNSAESGCRCVEHHPGLGKYAPDPIAYEKALAEIRPLRLRVVTMPVVRGEDCDGSMTCGCNDCISDRVARRSRGSGDQPWIPKPARRAA